MTIARTGRPPTQESCRRLACRWWVSRHPPRRVLTNDDCWGLPSADQGLCRRLACRWWIAQYPPSVLYREFAGDSLLRLTRTGSGEPRPRKPSRRSPPAGPPPTATSSASNASRRTLYEGLGGQHEPNHGPVGTESGPLALCGYLQACNRPVTQPTRRMTARLPNTTELKTRDTRRVLNNDDCSGLPPASPGIMPAVGRPLVDCSVPS